MRKRIYLSPPHMSGREIEFVKEAFKTNWIAPFGPHIDAFEREFAGYIYNQGLSSKKFGDRGVKKNTNGYAVAVSTGTAGLHLVLRALGVSSGDIVLCSDLTFYASATPVVYQGGEPVFIDSEERSWNMDPELLEEELEYSKKKGKMPKAVIIVHLYGNTADMASIMKICGKYRIPVIEDSAEALGSEYIDSRNSVKKAGTIGYAGVFSFNGNKIITTSSGGMVISKDKKLIDKIRYLANQARDPVPYYQHSEIGYNYRMSNILAGIGRGQLKVINERVLKKRYIFNKYKEKLKNLRGISFMPEPEWSRSNMWLTCILIDKKTGIKPEDLRVHLEKYNIESRPLWKPMHLQPVFKNFRCRGGKISEKLFETGLCLPSGTCMKDKDIEMICEIIINYFKKIN